MTEIFLNKLVNGYKIIKTFFNRDLLIATVIGINLIHLLYAKMPFNLREIVEFIAMSIQLALFFLLLYSSIKTNFSRYKTIKQVIIYIVFFIIYYFFICLIYNIMQFTRYTGNCPFSYRY
jgi:TRAP-type C4-dicarboxylate transport system permease small subunit